jgi:hypothetical protein
VQKIFHPISLAGLSVSLVIVPVLHKENNKAAAHINAEPYLHTSITPDFIPGKPVITVATALYQEMELDKSGLSMNAFEYAYRGYQKLLEIKKILNPEFLVICDFSQSSGNKRMYIINLSEKELHLQTYVAHGRNSGTEYATRFSNKPKSHQSSLGFYITGNTYKGKYGLALNLLGLEPGFNDMAARRKVVLHGSDYVGENYLKRSPYMGRSFGCPAVPKIESKTIINLIKNGTCLFIYHPDKKYIKGSKLIND